MRGSARALVAAGAVGLVGAAVSSWFWSPWPAALMIRRLFQRNALELVDEMQRHVPAGVRRRLDLPYGDGGEDTSFDWFAPSGTGAMPAVVWIHGGAWISGTKENVDPYVEILASHGFAAVSLNYTVSPAVAYPHALEQLNAALAHLVRNAEELRIDPSRIVLAGDSAGANLASQLAVLTTSPGYAKELGIVPALTVSQLKGVVLNCGIYDVSGIPNEPGIGGWGFRIALWSYLGKRDWSPTRGAAEMSTLGSVTKDFPPVWISGGNADPLTPRQSKRLAERLRGLGVDVTSVFYTDDHVPELPHEYQFRLGEADSRAALDSTVAFLRRVTA